MLPTTLVSRPTELDIGTYLVCTYFRAIKFDRMAYILKAHTRAFVFNFEIYHKISSLKENNLEWYILLKWSKHARILMWRGEFDRALYTFTIYSHRTKTQLQERCQSNLNWKKVNIRIPYILVSLICCI